MSSGTGSAVLAATVDLAKGADAYRFTEVDVAGYGGGADVEPVWVIGSEFFVGGCFHNVHPRGDFEFACYKKLAVQGGDPEEGEGIPDRFRN
jgi:hypothetical protein